MRPAGQPADRYAEGSACWTNGDCAAGLFCSASGVCESAGAGQEGELCVTSADCAKALACDLFGAGGVCVAAGTGEVGAPCTQITDCLAGLGCTDRGMCQPLPEAVAAGTAIVCEDDSAPFRVHFQVPRRASSARLLAGSGRACSYRAVPIPRDGLEVSSLSY